MLAYRLEISGWGAFFFNLLWWLLFVMWAFVIPRVRRKDEEANDERVTMQCLYVGFGFTPTVRISLYDTFLIVSTLWRERYVYSDISDVRLHLFWGSAWLSMRIRGVPLRLFGGKLKLMRFLSELRNHLPADA